MEISSLRGSPGAALIAWFPDQGVLWLDGSSIILLRFIAVPKSYSGFGSCIFLARSFEVVAYGFCGWRGLFRPQDSCIPDAVYSIFKIHEIRFLSPFACIGEEVGNLIPFMIQFQKNMLTLKSVRKSIHITIGHNGIWMTMMIRSISMKFSFQR